MKIFRSDHFMSDKITTCKKKTKQKKNNMLIYELKSLLFSPAHTGWCVRFRKNP